MQEQEISSVIERIQKMEQYYDAVSKALDWDTDEEPDSIAIGTMMQELSEYMDSGLWKQDYECDERGELPGDLKRGVLSEDGLYNMLSVMW